MKPRAIDLDGVMALPQLVGIMILLDRSGSMASIRPQMQAAFDAFVAEQRAIDPDGLWLSLRQFDSLGYDAMCDRTPIRNVGPLAIVPRGDTPLADAVMRFVGEAQAIIDDVADPTERLVLVVISDGQENASRTYSMAQARAALEAVQGPNCELLWLGNQEAIHHAVAQGLVGQSATATWVGENVRFATRGLSQAVYACRAGESGAEVLKAYVATDGTTEASLETHARLRKLAATRTESAR